MRATNHRGYPVKCLVCKTEELHEYRVVKPPFADALDSEYIGWCIVHKGEGLAHYNKRVQEIDRANQNSSDS